MKKVRIFLVLIGLALLGMSGGCAANSPYYGPYSTTYGIPTIAMTAAGAAIGSSIGPRYARGQNAVLGGLIGAMAGTAMEYSIYEQERHRRYVERLDYYEPRVYRRPVYFGPYCGQGYYDYVY